MRTSCVARATPDARQGVIRPFDVPRLVCHDGGECVRRHVPHPYAWRADDNRDNKSDETNPTLVNSPNIVSRETMATSPTTTSCEPTTHTYRYRAANHWYASDEIR